MKNIDSLIEIAEDLKLNDLLSELIYIKNRLLSDNKELIIPVIGEFSSGKTTLINALTNSKKLETASKATTSVIYEVYFDSEEEYAEIISTNGEVSIIKNIEEIKNDSLNNVDLIRIYDKSNKLDKSTILVDTPGLSSNDPKHLEALSRYLPNSDALLLFSDINQQLTKSLLSFLETNELLHLPIYLVITKKDTKNESEIENIKNYILNNIKIPVENVIFISSTKDDLFEFYKIIEKIQEEKNSIVENVLEHRLKKTKDFLINYLQNLILNSKSDISLEVEIKNQNRNLDKLNNSINRLIEDVQGNLRDIENNFSSQFETIMFSKLDSIVAGKSKNLDNDVLGIINSNSNILFTNYQKQVKARLFEIASERRNTEIGISLRSLESIDFSEINLGQLSYDINLSEAGKSQVKYISNSIKIAAAVAAVAVVVVSAGTAGPAVAAVTGSTSAAAGTIATGANLASKAGAAINIADTASDIASIKSNRSTRKMILEQSKKVDHHIKQIQSNIEVVNQYNEQAGKLIETKKEEGFIESMVGTATDSVLGKPQRKKLINTYLEESLIPEFKNKMSLIGLNLLSDIQESLKLEASITIEQLRRNLEDMKELKAKEKDRYDLYISNLKNQLELLKHKK